MMDKNKIQEAVQVLHDGGIVVYPTETVYGIGCDPLNAQACENIQRLKQREEAKTLLLLATSLEQVEEFAGELDEMPRRLAGIFWPGPLTLVISPKNELPPYCYGRSNGVAFRVTSYPAAEALISGFGRPITSTSANLTGETPIVTYEDALATFGDTADMVLPAEEGLHGKPSTVIDVTTKHLALIREGSISLSRIEEVL